MKDDDPPEKRKQQIVILKKTLKKHGKLRCQVPDCNKTFISTDGFLYHWKSCGKEVNQLASTNFFFTEERKYVVGCNDNFLHEYFLTVA